MSTVERKPESRWTEFGESLRSQWWVHLLIAGALTLVLGGARKSWPEPLVVYAVTILLSVSISTFTTAFYVFVWGTVLIEGSPLRRALLHGLSIAVGVAGGTEIALGILKLVTALGYRISVQREGIWQVGGVVTVAVMTASVIYDRLRERARMVEQREQQVQQALLRAQVDSLQSRVNPHFLFNALNTVASLVEDEPERAVEAIERLSVLLRYSLEGAAQGSVGLGRELASVRDYLTIEQLRFGERLRTRIEVDPETEGSVVPPFLLQPLVENAVKHGIASRRAGGVVDLRVESRDERLWIRVYNDGPAEVGTHGTRVGHDNLRQRLELLYGKDAGFEAAPCEGGYEVILELPRAGLQREDVEPAEALPERRAE